MPFNEIIRLDQAEYAQRQGQYVAGPAIGFFSALGVMGWPTDFWTIEYDPGTDDMHLHPAALLNEYTVAGAVDTRDGGRTFLLSSVFPGSQQNTQHTTPNVPGVVPWVEVVTAETVDGAIDAARLHAEAAE